MKKEVNAFEYTAQIVHAMQHGGVLLTTKAGDQVNTMTIGWGTMGVEWKKPIFTVYVRESRYTREMLEKNGEFTVNIPMEDTCREILAHCGKTSGRNEDKVKALGLHLVDSDMICVPGIRELPLTLECKVLYKVSQDPAAMPEEVVDRFYPEGKGKTDNHIAFYAEILKAYLIED